MSTIRDAYFSADESASSSSNDSFYSASDGLGDLVHNTFNLSSNHNLNICHINAQSVPSHYSDLSEVFTGANVHAILISESWLKPHLPSILYPIPGFILIRNDRIDRRGGGVAVYLRSDFKYKILASSSPFYSASAEYLFLEVWARGVKLLLGVIYCPPSLDYFSSLETVLESLGSEYAHHIIMGDLNTDLLASQSSRSLKLLTILESVSLHVLPMQATHHNTDGNDTWLDLIITSDSSLVSSHGQYPAPSFSHHDLIYICYTLNPPKSPPKVLYLRCFGRIDRNKLDRDAANLNWDELLTATSIDEKVGIFNAKITTLFDIHAPFKKIKMKRSPAPWITRGVRMAMRRRDRAFRQYRRDRSDANWCLYKAARNRCNQMVRNAKRRHILSNISSSSIASIWRFLGSLGIGKDKHLEYCGASIGLDDFNLNFLTPSLINHRTKRCTIDYLSGLSSPNIAPFQFSPVSLSDIKKVILSIKSNATGCDKISRRMLVPILDYVLPPILDIINGSFSTGVFPSLWRKAFVIPIPKIPNPSLPKDFRPISILPFLSKVLEACAHKQLAQYVHLNSLLCPLQSGFRPGHSTVTALLKVTDDIRAGMEDTKVTVLALIDFSNAFNTVSHDILLAVLSHLLVSPSALEWFSSYLQGRQQSVRLGDSSSSWCVIGSGVPQGGILSPLLFSIFINFITQNLQCAYHLYADDLQIYSQEGVDSIAIAVDKINRDLSYIKDWSDSFGLTVNPAKCQAIIVGSSRMISRLDLTNIPAVLFNNTIIPWCSSIKDLGLYIDSSLSWRPQVTSVCRRVTGTLRTLYRLRNFLPPKTKTMLVQALILPIIDYGDVCYFDLNADQLNKLDRLLNNCIRFVYNLRKYDHVSNYRRQLKWLPIRQRRSLRALTTLFSLLTSPSLPAYLSSNFQYLGNSHNRNLRSSNNLLLKCPPHSSDFLHSAFTIQSILLWNSLPLEIRMSTTRLAFKVRVRQLLSIEAGKSPP